MARRPDLRKLHFEPLEDRRVLSAFSRFPPLEPIDPSPGDAEQLRVAQQHADAGNVDALDDFPVPLVVATQVGDGGVSITNWKTKSTLRLDVDGSKATGQGGKDLRIEVNTVRPGGASDDWNLSLTVERLGNSPFVQDVALAIALPFDAFNGESLPGAPNILMGFEVSAGGVAADLLEMHLYPHQLSGSVHDFQWDIQTVGADNAMTFFSGQFDGDHDTGYVNGTVMSADVADVPDEIHVDLSVAESPLGSGPTSSVFDVMWSASSETPVTFTYAEAESAAAASGLETADFVTQMTTDMMPTSEQMKLSLDEAAGRLTLDHASNAAVGQMTLRKTRSDGLDIAADLSDLPTDVDLDLDVAGGLDLDVNANTLDLNLQVSQAGGFDNTGGFLGYNLVYLSTQLHDAPDLTAHYDTVDKSFHAAAVNSGEHIPYLELILDDDGTIDDDGTPADLELPPSYDSADDTPPDPRPHHLFSLIDDGTHGTVVARAVGAELVTFDHDVGPLGESLELHTVAAAPLQFHLRTGVGSSLVPAPVGTTGPGPYAEITCDIDDVPGGHSLIELNPPVGFSVVSDIPVGAISCSGRVGTFHAGLALEDIPAIAGFDFRPEGSLDVVAADASGAPDSFGAIVAHLFDENGFDPNIVALPPSAETFFPANTRLKDARLRLDGVPTLSAVWNDQPKSTLIEVNTALDADVHPTNPLAYVEGLQLAIATTLAANPQIDLAHFSPATDASPHYARMIDRAGEQAFEGGMFGVDRFRFSSEDTGPEPGLFELDWNLRPDRPFTPFSLDIDAVATPLGALGAFFGNDHVTGGLDLAYLPSQLNLTGDLDPVICTNGLFGVELPPELVPPIPSTLDLDLSVNDTLLLVHAEDLPPVFCLTWDTSNPTGVIQVVAEERNGDPALAGLVEVLFQNDVSLPGDAAIFEDADNPLRELRIRLDDAPSFEGLWHMRSADPNFVLGTAAEEGEPFSILGGLRLTTGTEIGSQELPVFEPLTGQEAHFFEFLDQGPDKKLALGVFGVDEVGVWMRNDISTVNLSYQGDVDRPLRLHIASEDGIFFPDTSANVAVLIEDLPQRAEMAFTTTGNAFSLQASDGIDRIRVGGPALLGLEGEDAARFDTVRSELDMQSLPAELRFANIANETIHFDLPDAATIGSVVSHVWDADGPGLDQTDDETEEGQPTFGDPLRDIRVRFDEIPSLGAVWGTALSVPVKNVNFRFRSLQQGEVVVNRTSGASAVVLEDFDIDLPLRLIHARNGAFSPDDELATADRLGFQSLRKPFFVGDVVRGHSSGAQGKVARIDRVADRGDLYLIDVVGDFQDGEALLVGDLFYGFASGELVESQDATAKVEEDGSEVGMRFEMQVEDPQRFVAGAQFAASTAVGLAPLPLPAAALNHQLLVEDRRIGQSAPAAGQLQFGMFDLNAVQFETTEQITAAFESASARPLDVAFRRDFGGAFGAEEDDQAINLELTIDAVPASLALTADVSGALQYEASETIDAIDLNVVLDHVDDGGVRNLNIADGLIDIDGNGLVNLDDDGFYDNVRVIDGALDIDGDGDIDADDDTNTDSEIDGIVVIDGALDLDGSGAADAADSAQQNGTRAGFALTGLPSEIELRAHPGVMPVIEGYLDLNGDGDIDEADSGRFAGFMVTDGVVYVPGIPDGTVPAFSTHLNQRFRSGRVDLDGDGDVDAQDRGSFGGLELSMSAGIEQIRFAAETLGDTANLFNAESGSTRLVDLSATQIPAQWKVFFSQLDVETNAETPDNAIDLHISTADSDGQAQPFGRIAALISDTNDPFELAHQMLAFEQQTTGEAGAVIAGGTPQRVNYSPFAQEIDARYYEAGDAEGVLEKLREIYAQGGGLDTSQDYLVARQAAGALQLLNADLGGVQSASLEVTLRSPESAGGPIPIDQLKATLRAPTPGERPFYFGWGQSAAEITAADDGTYRGVRVIDGELDLNGDGEIGDDDTDGIVGLSVVNGRLDLNGDGLIDAFDDGFLEGLRVIDGRLDVDEALTTIEFDNVPDEVVAELAMDPGRLRYSASDDADASTGRVDLYHGPMPLADDNDTAARIIIDDVPDSVEVRWGVPTSSVGIPTPFFEVNSSSRTEVLGVVQMKLIEDGAPLLDRIVFGMQVEDLQLGYDLDLFSFDVAERLELTLGTAIIDGKVDIDNNGLINNQDDGSFGGVLGIGAVTVINGFLDMDGDGNVDVDSDDDGAAGGFTVIDGRIDVDENGVVDVADDFDNTILSLPTAWDLLRATVGVDNDADNLEIEANFNKTPVNGFVNFYRQVSDPQPLAPGGPAPGSVEYTPLLSLVLDDFRELSGSAAVTLDPFSPNVPTLPFSLVAEINLEGSIVFDFWAPIDVQASFTIDFPDWTGLEDLEVGVENLRDYIDSTPIHLFPVTGVFGELIADGSIFFAFFGLHDDSDHEDPFN